MNASINDPVSSAKPDPDDTGFVGVPNELKKVICALEKHRLRERLRRGRERKRAQTGRCEGRKPFGTLAGEAEILNIIIELRTRQQLTTRRIADHLNERGIPSRTGRSWTGPVVSKILRRELKEEVGH